MKRRLWLLALLIPAIALAVDNNLWALTVWKLMVAGVERISVQAAGIVVNDTGADSDFRIESDTDTNLFVADAGLASGAGRIGIGTATPDTKLHVVGSIKMVDGNQANGSLLRSDANGVGAWTSLSSMQIPTGSGHTNTIAVWNGTATLTDYTSFSIDGTTLNALALSADGAAVFNDSGAAVDFRVEGDTDPNAFVVKGSNNRVGIGTSAPARELSVVGVISATGSGAGMVLNNRATNAESGLLYSPTAGNIRLHDVVAALDRLTIESANGGDVGIGVAPTSVTASADLDVQGTIRNEAWIACSFENSWVNFGSVYTTCAYMRDKVGFVHVKGKVKSGSSATAVVFTLPANYRPAERHVFPSVCNGAFCRVDVETDGKVSFVSGGSTTDSSMDSVSFRAVNF